VKQSAYKRRKNRYKKTKRRSSGILLKRLWLTLKCVGILAVLMAVSMIFMVTYTTITTADYFNAKTINIKGNRHIAQQEVLAQAGMQPGDNILALNLHAIRKRLMSHPWIHTARVARQIPHTIIVHVEEHHPLAYLDLGPKLLIDMQGRIFKEYTSGDPEHLPMISGIEYTDLNPENLPLTRPMETAIQVLQFSRREQSVLPYDGIERLHFDHETGVTVTMRDKALLIRLGFGQLAKKNEKIRQLLRYIEDKPQWQGVCSLDANNPDRIVVKPGSTLQAKAKGV
jgi:cell division septal protein FtsQ